jgi:hypothetical protein
LKCPLAAYGFVVAKSYSWWLHGQLGHPCCKRCEISSTSSHVAAGYNVSNQISVKVQTSSGNKETMLMSTSVKNKKIMNLQYSTIRHGITNLKVVHCISNVSPLLN